MKLTKVLMVCAAVSALACFAGCSTDGGDSPVAAVSVDNLTPWGKANKNSEITVNGNTYSINHSISVDFSESRWTDTYVKNIDTPAYGLKGTINVEEQADNKTYLNNSSYGAGYSGVIFGFREHSTGKVSFGMLRVFKNSKDTKNWKIQLIVCKKINVDNLHKWRNFEATEKTSEQDFINATGSSAYYYCIEQDVESSLEGSANGKGNLYFEINQITDKTTSSYYGGFNITVKESENGTTLFNKEIRGLCFDYDVLSTIESFSKKYGVIEGVLVVI